MSKAIASSTTLSATVLLIAVAGGSRGADFVSEVRPILSAKCFACHGPDEHTREADLRLDEAFDATADRGGYAAVVPGDPNASEVVARIESDDEDLLMPPADSGKSLTPAEAAILRDWITEGGGYEAHWAFERVERPEVPEPVAASRPHPIDWFVGRRAGAAGLAAARPADPYTLIRRVFLDLIGLPPTPEEADAFAADPSAAAYEQVVDRLLASPRYGERWARPWLDLARYSDTKGYEKDQPRTMWPYRDWVINAINSDTPFDQFTIEQLAGDLLPDPTLDQLIATGFHRNTMTNEEGGIDPQEFRYLSVVDRVATTGATWLGLTLGCAQCHTHKYDPITHTDYFAFFALFNNADEPEVPLPEEGTETRRREIAEQIRQMEGELSDRLLEKLAETREDPEQAMADARDVWCEASRIDTPRWLPTRPMSVKTNLPTTEVLDDGSVLISGDVTNADRYTVDLEPTISHVTAMRIETLPHPSLPTGGAGRRVIGDGDKGRGNFLLTELTAQVAGKGEPVDIKLIDATASFVSPGLEANLAIDGRPDTGWTVEGRQRERQTLVVRFAKPVELAEGEQLRVTLRHDSFYPSGIGRFRLSLTDRDGAIVAHGLEDPTIEALHLNEGERTAEQNALLEQAFVRAAPELEADNTEIARLRNAILEQTHALVMRERTKNRRVTKRHHRGEYLKPREEVQPDTPAFLPSMPAEATRDRLSLARWLVSRDNPLTARVVVNRHWQAFFGRGLVKTTADFGMQGDYPTHPELLDWLAAEFMETGWSRKQLHRSIVTSDTYRQSSLNAEAQRVDPENKLLARMSRIRVDAEQVRDVVLSTAGLLSPKLGGPSVFPPQPPGITEAAYGPLSWIVSEGEDRYRRGLYTFNKRTAPYAAFGLFDAPSGEVCVPRRNRSNTPLQALALLNDEAINEAARALAKRTTSAASGDREIAELALRQAVTRPVSSEEVESVVAFVDTQRKRLAAGELDPQRILNAGPKYEWTFVSDSTGWEARNDSEVRAEEGTLVIDCLGEDPYIGVDVQGPQGEYTFRFTAEADHGVSYEVYWTTEEEPTESPERRILIEAPDRKRKDYRATLVTTSPLRSIRLDTGGEPGVTRLHNASLVYGDGIIDINEVSDPVELTAWHLAARAILNLDEVVTKP